MPNIYDFRRNLQLKKKKLLQLFFFTITYDESCVKCSNVSVAVLRFQYCNGISPNVYRGQCLNTFALHYIAPPQCSQTRKILPNVFFSNFSHIVKKKLQEISSANTARPKQVLQCHCIVIMR